MAEVVFANARSKFWRAEEKRSKVIGIDGDTRGRWGWGMYKLSQSVRKSDCQEGAIILDIAQGRMFDLNPIAAKMLACLGEGQSDKEIARNISREFEMHQEEVSSDLQQFIQVLLDNKLLEKDSSTE